MSLPDLVSDREEFDQSGLRRCAGPAGGRPDRGPPRETAVPRDEGPPPELKIPLDSRGRGECMAAGGVK